MWVEQVSAWSTLATAVFTAALAAMAFFAWRTAKATLDASRRASEAAEAANEQARRDSIEQTRPYVYVEVIPGLWGVGAYDVRISNSGRSTARQVTLEFDSWPEAPDDIAQEVQRLFATPRTLPPGTTLRAIWRIEGHLADGTREAGMGTDGQIAVSYTSDDPSQPSYSDVFDVMISNSGLWPVAEEGPTADDLKGDIRKFYRLGQVLVRRVGELGR